MKPVMHKNSPPWMADKNLCHIMNVLGRDNALMVGGCVRNFLLNLPVKDIDIATKINPDKVVSLLVAAGVKVVPTGIRFGTVTAVTDTGTYEITTLRRDIATDGRHAIVGYSDDWQEDAARRDFTINALYADYDGHIYDPLGGGLKDLESGIVRFIGDAKQRIAEDHLRILRYFRFAARYGRGGRDDVSFAACRDMRGAVDDLSSERVTDEMYKILSDMSAPTAIDLMCEAGIFDGVISRDKADILRWFIDLQGRYNQVDIDTRFYVLFGKSYYKKLLFSNKIKSLFNSLNDIVGGDFNVPLFLYRFGRRATVQGAMIAHVAYGGAVENIDMALSSEIPVFPVDATMVMREYALGQGPKIGEILRGIENLWIENNFQGDGNYLIKQFNESI